MGVRPNVNLLIKLFLEIIEHSFNITIRTQHGQTICGRVNVYERSNAISWQVQKLVYIEVQLQVANHSIYKLYIQECLFKCI